MIVTLKVCVSTGVQEGRSLKGAGCLAVHNPHFTSCPDDRNYPSLHPSVVETLASSGPNTSLESQGFMNGSELGRRSALWKAGDCGCYVSSWRLLMIFPAARDKSFLKEKSERHIQHSPHEKLRLEAVK